MKALLQLCLVCALIGYGISLRLAPLGSRCESWVKRHAKKPKKAEVVEPPKVGGEWEDWENFAHVDEEYGDDDQEYVNALIGLSAGFLSEMSRTAALQPSVLPQTSGAKNNNTVPEQLPAQSAEPKAEDKASQLSDIPRQGADQDWSNWSEEPPYFDDAADDEDFLDETPSSRSLLPIAQKQSPFPSPPSSSLLTSATQLAEASSGHSAEALSKQLLSLTAQVAALQTQIGHMEKRLARLQRQRQGPQQSSPVAVERTATYVFLTLFLVLQYVLVSKL